MGDTWAPREGAYGRTRDGRRVGPIERVFPNCGYHDEMHRPMTADELDAAARVLTELAEALRDGR